MLVLVGNMVTLAIPIGGDSKLIIEVVSPDTEMILFETDNHYGAYSKHLIQSDMELKAAKLFVLPTTSMVMLNLNFID